MKANNIFRFFAMTAISAVVAAMPSCSNDDFTWDPKWLDADPVPFPEEEAPAPPAQEPTYTFETITKNVKLDKNVTYQTLEGIGASDCWLPNIYGEYWTGKRAQMAEYLFSRDLNNGHPKGIGLSTWRVNLGAGTEELGAAGGIDDDNAGNRAPSYWDFNKNDGSLDWTKCVGQRYFMEQAKNYGVESYVLFSNSPLVQYTKNGQGRSQSGAQANLKNEYYDDFAEYMATVAEHFVNLGYNISHISPVNEPQYTWNGSNQEGSGWQNTQVARIARELQKALDGKGISTKISLGEAGSYASLYSGNKNTENTLAAFFTPSSEAYVGDLSRLDNISSHSYWTDGNWNEMVSARKRVAETAAQYGAKIWQSEWSMLDSNGHYGENLTDETTPMDVAQWMSAVIHNDFTVAGVTAWHYWTAMSVERWSQMDRFMLLNCVPAGGNYSNDFYSEGTVQAFPTLWVLGNYSLFIRPGYKRIEMDVMGNDYFFGNAWVSPDGNTIVCVYTNRYKDRGVRVPVNYKAWGKNPASIWRYTTTASKNLEGDKWSADYPVVCEPSSVTTVVYQLN